MTARVLIAAEAQSRGFRNALAFRRWCRSHGVELLRDGRRLWVRPADIDAALERIAAPVAPSNDARIMAAVESIVHASAHRHDVRQARDSSGLHHDVAPERKAPAVHPTVRHRARRIADDRG